MNMGNSKLILGTVQMGLAYGINNLLGQIDIKETQKILNFCIQNSLETIDTAEAYGDAHKIIGEYHEKSSNKFKIITKIPHDIAKLDSITIKADQYIKDLRVNSIDTLMFHSFDTYQESKHLKNELFELKENEKISKFGVSVYTNQEIEELVEDSFVDVVQLPFNLLDNINLRGEHLKQLKEKNKEVHVRSAFLQGLFFKDVNSNNPIVNSLKTELNFFNQLALDNNISMMELALGYCLAQATIDKVIIGVDSLEQLKNNIRSTKVKISDDIFSQINSIKITNIDLLNPSKWRIK